MFRRTWLTVAALAGVAALIAHPSNADSAAKRGITIKAVLDGKETLFKGPSRIERGAELTFVNDSVPKKIGPHTITLLEAELVPEVKTRKDAEACFTEGICGVIARAHRFDPRTEKVNKPSVDVGRKGAWDEAFGKKGDSFYTEEEGGTQTRKVVAPVGTRLTFFCAVHPEMVKHVKVVG
jgi:hypothetical protein